MFHRALMPEGVSMNLWLMGKIINGNNQTSINVALSVQATSNRFKTTVKARTPLKVY